jgi:leucyl/phenylalanyl-tRNA--protein transferase
VHLVAGLRTSGFKLLDTQWITPHLRQFGAEEVPRDEYHEMLVAALEDQEPGGLRPPELRGAE